MNDSSSSTTTDDGDESVARAKSLLIFAADKAGMHNVDRQKVNKVILEASKGSSYYDNELRKSQIGAAVIKRLRAARATFKSLPASAQLAAHQQAAATVAKIPHGPSDRIFMHLDMDMFFCAVEMRDNAALTQVPFAVGGNSMISTANYLARQRGVRSAMPGFIAKKLCPELVFVRPNMRKYAAVGEVVRRVLREYDPSLHSASCDEAGLDLTDYVTVHGFSRTMESISALVSTIRQRVTDATGGLTCSAGVAPTRLAAKICSDTNKPNGQYILEPSQFEAFIARLPIRKLLGIGKSRETILQEGLGISTCQDLIDNACLILEEFSTATSTFLLRASRGLDPPIAEPTPRKSVGCERTFSGTGSFAALCGHLAKISRNVQADLQTKQLRGQALTLKVKLTDFTVRNVTRQLDHPVASSQDIYKVAVSLLEQAFPELAPSALKLALSRSTPEVRLLGIRMTQLRDAKASAPALTDSSAAPPPQIREAEETGTRAAVEEQELSVPEHEGPPLRKRRRKRLRELSIVRVQSVTGRSGTLTPT